MTAAVSLDEYFSVLQRSNAPTLVVEGDDDYLAFREFEVENIDKGLTIFPVTGKNNVLSIIARRDQIPNPRLVFLLDMDEWSFCGAAPYDQLGWVILTNGWSIENDLLRDGAIERLMTRPERDRFECEKERFAVVFSAALHCKVTGNDGPNISTHPNQVLDRHGNLRFGIEEQMVEPFDNEDCLAHLRQDLMRYLRGKSLLQLCTRQLSRPGRQSNFSKANLLEICAAARGPNIRRIEQEALEALFQL